MTMMPTHTHTHTTDDTLPHRLQAERATLRDTFWRVAHPFHRCNFQFKFKFLLAQTTTARVIGSSGTAGGGIAHSAPQTEGTPTEGPALSSPLFRCYGAAAPMVTLFRFVIRLDYIQRATHTRAHRHTLLSLLTTDCCCCRCCWLVALTDLAASISTREHDFAGARPN